MRYIVWACFGVDADSPEQAKERIKTIVHSGVASVLYIEDWGKRPCAEHNPYNVNTTVFISPELDKMLGEIEEG